MSLQPNDFHIIVNDWEIKFIGEMKCYNAAGYHLWTIPALSKGVEGPRWDVWAGDTPPGKYLCGLITETQPQEPPKTWNAYGRYFVDLESLDGNEERSGRAGIGIHGGGSSLHSPLADYQPLTPTYGCIRVHNKDLQTRVLYILNAARDAGGRIFVTVNQPAK